MENMLTDDPNVEPQYRIEESNIRENWPDDLDLAVCLTIDTQGTIDALREGSEDRQYHSTTRWPGNEPNWLDFSERQYGIARGLPRLLDLLADYDIEATFPTCGRTAEWYPEAVAEIVKRGHEIANHSYSHYPLFTLDEAEEREEIRKSADILEELTGERPTGFRCPIYTVTDNTFDLLLEQEYAWESSLHNRDIPYFLSNGEDRILELPVHLDDWGLYLMQTRQGGYMGGYPRGTPEGVLSVLQSEFDCLYREGRESSEPRMFMYTMHPKISGRPHRTNCLREFIEYAQEKDGVRFTTCGEIAKMAMGR